jgi:hypothetical protein
VSVSVRFSGLIRLPPINRAAATIANILPLFIAVGSALLLYWVLSETASSPALTTRQILLCIGMAVVVGTISIVLGQLWATHLHRRRLTAWCRERAATDEERAAANLHDALLGASKRTRAQAVSRFLKAVPLEASRTLAIGDPQFAAVDDGTLYEECDVLERKNEMRQRRTAAVLACILLIHFVIAVRANGLNPLHWSAPALLNLVPVLMMVLLSLQAIGLLRPLGKVVLAAPRRVEYTSIRGTRVFTADDSVLVVRGFSPYYIASLHRDDGVTISLPLQQLDATGIQNMFSRWCMVQAEADSASAHAISEAAVALVRGA